MRALPILLSFECGAAFMSLLCRLEFCGGFRFWENLWTPGLIIYRIFAVYISVNLANWTCWFILLVIFRRYFIRIFAVDTGHESRSFRDLPQSLEISTVLCLN